MRTSRSIRIDGDLIGQRAADAAETEQHDVRARLRQRPAAADLRQLKRGVDPARGFRPHPRPTTTNEMLRSDDPCAMATTLMPPASSAVNTRAEMPGVPAMPSPTTATTDICVRARDAVDPAVRDLLAQALLQARHRAVGLVCRAR